MKVRSSPPSHPGASSNQPPEEEPSLHRAVRSGQYQPVQDTLEQLGALDINARNAAGDTALHLACSATPPNMDIIALLLERGADLRLNSRAGLSPWNLIGDSLSVDDESAAERDVDILSEAEPDNYFTAFFCLTAHWHIRHMGPLPHNGNGETILSYACKTGNMRVINWLLSHPGNDMAQQDISDEKNHPLHHAVRLWNQPTITQKLLNYGALVKVKNAHELTAIEYLLHGLKQDMQTGTYPFSITLYPADSTDNGIMHQLREPQQVNFLLAAGARLEETDKHFLFQLACSEGWLTIVKTMLTRCNMSPNRDPTQALAPMAWAIAGKRYEVAKHLLEQGAHPNIIHAPTQEHILFTLLPAALNVSVHHPLFQLVKALIKHPQLVQHLRDPHLNTLFHILAKRQGATSIMLCQAVFDQAIYSSIDGINRDKQSAIDIARTCKNTAVYCLLSQPIVEAVLCPATPLPPTQHYPLHAIYGRYALSLHQECLLVLHLIRQAMRAGERHDQWHQLAFEPNASHRFDAIAHMIATLLDEFCIYYHSTHRSTGSATYLDCIFTDEPHLWFPALYPPTTEAIAPGGGVPRLVHATETTSGHHISSPFLLKTPSLTQHRQGSHPDLAERVVPHPTLPHTQSLGTTQLYCLLNETQYHRLTEEIQRRFNNAKQDRSIGIC